MIITCIAQRLYEANFEILHCSGGFARRHNCKPECSFMKHVLIFLPRKYDVISQLRRNFAKDPLCVTRLK